MVTPLSHQNKKQKKKRKRKIEKMRSDECDGEDAVEVKLERPSRHEHGVAHDEVSGGA